MTNVALGTFLIASVLALGCTKAPVVRAAWDGRSGPPRVVESEPATPPPSAADRERERQMHEHLDALALVGPHIVRGEVQQAAAVATQLLERLDAVGGPEPWRPHLAALRVEVRALANAEDLGTAATANARIAAQCGACHQALGAVPRLDDAPMPARGHDEQAAMRLHAWGVARLHEGLLVPSSERWLQGTATFAALPGCEQPEPTRHELCSRVKALAHRAHVVETTDARIRLYGELLGTCASCHAVSPSA